MVGAYALEYLVTIVLPASTHVVPVREIQKLIALAQYPSRPEGVYTLRAVQRERKYLLINEQPIALLKVLTRRKRR